MRSFVRFVRFVSTVACLPCVRQTDRDINAFPGLLHVIVRPAAFFVGWLCLCLSDLDLVGLVHVCFSCSSACGVCGGIWN